jgi:hypothetical protein
MSKNQSSFVQRRKVHRCKLGLLGSNSLGGFGVFLAAKAAVSLLRRFHIDNREYRLSSIGRQMIPLTSASAVIGHR